MTEGPAPSQPPTDPGRGQVSESEHEHYWRRAFVKDGRGKTVIGRDCECGMQTTVPPDDYAWRR